MASLSQRVQNSPGLATVAFIAAIVALAVTDTAIRDRKKPATILEHVTGNTYEINPFVSRMRDHDNPLWSAYGYTMSDTYEPLLEGW